MSSKESDDSASLWAIGPVHEPNVEALVVNWSSVVAHPSEDLRRLLTLVLSAGSLQRLQEEGFPDADQEHRFLLDHELRHMNFKARETAVSLLYRTAIAVRAADDRMADRTRGWVKRRAAAQWNCAMLSENGGKDKKVYLREACNKIIHAQHMSFGADRVEEDRWYRPISETVDTSGVRNGTPWLCTINIPRYAVLGMHALTLGGPRPPGG